MNKVRNTLLLIVVALLISSCGGFNKIMKSTDNELKYQHALSYYAKKDFTRSNILFEQLQLPFERTDRDDTVNFYLAKGQYIVGEIEADISLRTFCNVFGRSPFAEEAHFLKAMNLYSSSYRFELDQMRTRSAIIAFNDYKRQYPNPDTSYLPKSIENRDLFIAKITDELQDRIERKSYESAKLYYHIDDHKAAIIALKNAYKDFPNSRYNEELMFLTLESAYMYAKMSVKSKQASRYLAALDEYYTFVSEYPTSKFSKQAETIHATLVKQTTKRGYQISANNPSENDDTVAE